MEHSFELTNERPIYHRPRRVPPAHQEIIKKELEMILDAGIVRPASSAWSFPVVIARKKDGKPRFCVDYRELNKVMKADRFPIPNMEEIMEDLQGSCVLSTLDLFSGYWQVRVSEDCKDRTTFTCKYGTYSFEVIPFGLMNAPATFQRMMNDILRDVPFAGVYIDDVVIFSTNILEHLTHIRTVLELLASFNLKLKLRKCSFAKEEVELLGHIV